MYNHLLFLSYWIINTLLLFLIHLIIGGSLMLGNFRFSPIEAAIYSGFWMTFILWVFWDFAIAKKILDKTSTRFTFFFGANLFALWAVTKFSYFTGFGQIDLLQMLIAGVLFTFLQRVVRSIIVKNSLH